MQFAARLRSLGRRTRFSKRTFKGPQDRTGGAALAWLDSARLEQTPRLMGFEISRREQLAGLKLRAVALGLSH